MDCKWNRRTFCRVIGPGLGAAWVAPRTVLRAEQASRRRIKIGHTGITWGRRPEDVQQAIKDIAGLGYWGYECFAEILEAWEEKGGLGQTLKQSNLPLISAYCGANLLDPAKRRDEVDKMVRRGELIKKCGGAIAVIGPNGVKRNAYDFSAHKADIVASLNDIAKALADIGVVGVLHQHTDTCVMTRDEVYSVMEAVDTRYVKFGPDVGQLAKGGADPVKIVKDFLPLIRHIHLKDFNGGEDFLGYCPLGQGKVDIPTIMDVLEKSDMQGMVMVELDPGKTMPITPLETARISKTYLKKIGYVFRS
jgi:inosose dehydratase